MRSGPSSVNPLVFPSPGIAHESEACRPPLLRFALLLARSSPYGSGGRGRGLDNGYQKRGRPTCRTGWRLIGHPDHAERRGNARGRSSGPRYTWRRTEFSPRETVLGSRQRRSCTDQQQTECKFQVTASTRAGGLGRSISIVLKMGLQLELSRLSATARHIVLLVSRPKSSLESDLLLKGIP
jgi:hypothetical protein